MANSTNIIKEVVELVRKNESQQLSGNARKLALADELFNKLVERGLLEKRGFTLRGIEDIHLLQVRPNI